MTGCAQDLHATLTYPNPTRADLALRDTYGCHTAGCQHDGRIYHWFWCPELGGYIHGGVDVHGELGDHLRACYEGRVRWLNWGPSFGHHQFAIVAPTGVAFFYAHMLSRPDNGAHVRPDDYVGRLGAESFDAFGRRLDIGPHLHLTVVVDLGDPQHSTRNPYVELVRAQRRARAA